MGELARSFVITLFLNKQHTPLNPEFVCTTNVWLDFWQVLRRMLKHKLLHHENITCVSCSSNCVFFFHFDLCAERDCIVQMMGTA